MIATIGLRIGKPRRGLHEHTLDGLHFRARKVCARGVKCAQQCALIRETSVYRSPSLVQCRRLSLDLSGRGGIGFE